MSKYGEKFEKALDKIFRIKPKARKTAIIIAVCIILLDIALTCMSMFIMNDEGVPILNDILGDGQGSEIMIYVLGVLMFAAIFIPLFIILYCSLNKRRESSRYRRVILRTCNIAKYLGQDEKALKAEFKKRRDSKDREWIIETTDFYFDECERLKTEREQNPPKEESENGGEGGFDGWLLQKFGWILLGALVTICTAGICFPLAYIWVLRWQYKHSLYDGKRLSFDGKVPQLLGKWVCWLLLCIPTVGIFILFIPKKLLQWKASHLHLAGELPFLGGTWQGNPIALLLVKLGCSLFTLITLWLLKPLAICWKNRFIQKRIIVDGRKMKFDGNGAQILGKWILWTLLTLITLGIYALFRNLRVLRWVNKHTHIKDGYRQIQVL